MNIPTAMLRLALLGSLVLSLPTWATNRAVLVGVSNYPNLADRMQLRGSGNDVDLMRTLLTSRGFAADQIQVLADGIENASLPTRANIIAALEKVATVAKSGDFVYLHFSGHGSQQPTAGRKAHPEPDGLDETFLPRDVGRWNDGRQLVDNALVDSEMDNFVTKIRNRGAFVWAVFDSCHSATMMRGPDPDEIRYRQVLPEDLGIPKAALEAAAKGAPRSRGNPEPRHGAVTKSGGEADAGNKGGLVAFYAAQTVETTPDMPLPSGEPARKSHGLFTFTLAEALTRYPNVTYRQLGQQIRQRYIARNVNSPTPLIEGSALDARVFNSVDGPPVRQWALKVDQGKVSIPAGSLNEFSEGALFALVPEAGSEDKDILGYLKADKVEPFSATLSPEVYDGKPAPAANQLKAGQYVRLVDPNLRLTLHIAVPPLDKLSKVKPSGDLRPDTLAETEARQIICELRAKKQEGGVRVEWASADKAADLQLMLGEGKLWLLPRGSTWVPDGPNRSYSIDLAKNQGKLSDLLVESFTKIAKATNLKVLAGSLGSKGVIGAVSGLELKMALTRAAASPVETLDSTSLSVLRDGDHIDLSMKNKSNRPMDITVLYIDSDYGISVFYPEPGTSNRIEAESPTSQAVKASFDINADTIGNEQLLVIAVVANKEDDPADFSFLQQPKLERSRGKGMGNPVVQLFELAGFDPTGAGTTRGGIAKWPKASPEVRVFNWQIESKAK